MRESNSPIGTLASKLTKDEINDENVVKVEVETDLKEDSFLKAKNFFYKEIFKKRKKSIIMWEYICFQSSQLKKICRTWRVKAGKNSQIGTNSFAMGNIDIKVGYCDSNPLSIDTLEDLKRVEKEMS